MQHATPPSFIKAKKYSKLKVPDTADKKLILELLETLSLTVVAEKFEIKNDSLSRILKEHWNTSVPAIKRAFRIKYLNENKNEESCETAKAWGVNISVVHRFKIEMGSML
ncbi:hypothetical protein N9878_01005 [bacterium]|nr:hypothetical protein [bacterium]